MTKCFSRRAWSSAEAMGVDGRQTAWGHQCWGRHRDSRNHDGLSVQGTYIPSIISTAMLLLYISFNPRLSKRKEKGLSPFVWKVWGRDYNCLYLCCCCLFVSRHIQFCCIFAFVLYTLSIVVFPCSVLSFSELTVSQQSSTPRYWGSSKMPWKPASHGPVSAMPRGMTKTMMNRWRSCWRRR